MYWTSLPRKSKEKKKERKEKKKKKKKEEEATSRKKEKKKKKKKKKEEATSRDDKKKKKSNVLDKVHVQVHIGIFVIYLSNSPHSVFSPFWRELFGEHTWLQLTFFSLPLPTKHFSKSFLSSFYLIFFFFHPPKIHSTKQTFKVNNAPV